MPMVEAHRRRRGRDLLSVNDLTCTEACALLAHARTFLCDGEVRRSLGLLAGRVVFNVFNEPSTRTRVSFELAARRMGAEVVNFAADSSSSRAKGESLRDTVCNVDAMGIDAVVVRDSEDGLPHAMTRWIRARVVNAGDGRNEHPTQALLDALTIVEALSRPIDGAATLAGLKIAVCGDIDHGRVAHSNIRLLPRLGATLRVAGPPALFSDATAAALGVTPLRSLEEAIESADVVMMLRIQRERLATGLSLPDPSRYHASWGLDETRLRLAQPGVIVLHPGPVGRGVELSDVVADGPRSRILAQVAVGVALRMAVLARACGVEPEPSSSVATSANPSAEKQTS